MRYYTATIGGGGSYYDDAFSLAASGNAVWASGLIQPLQTNDKGGDDAFLFQQGRILEDDSKMYLLGDIQTSGIVKVGVGSPTISRQYKIIPEGSHHWKINNEPGLKKIYLRALPLGSLAGE